MSNDTHSKGKIRIETEEAVDCMHCNEPVSKNAQRCPHCGGNLNIAVAVYALAFVGFPLIIMGILGWLPALATGIILWLAAAALAWRNHDR